MGDRDETINMNKMNVNMIMQQLRDDRKEQKQEFSELRKDVRVISDKVITMDADLKHVKKSMAAKRGWLAKVSSQAAGIVIGAGIMFAVSSVWLTKGIQ